jgi:hypothetical protein
MGGRERRFRYPIRTRGGIFFRAALDGRCRVPVGTKGQRRVPSAGFPSSTDTPFCRYPPHSRVACPCADFSARNLSIIKGGRYDKPT